MRRLASVNQPCRPGILRQSRCRPSSGRAGLVGQNGATSVVGAGRARMLPASEAQRLGSADRAV